VINANRAAMKTFPEGEIYFVSNVASLILSALKLRKRFAATDRGVA
jgi:hypothetical protein